MAGPDSEMVAQCALEAVRVDHPPGVPRSKETSSPQDPTVALCLRPYGGPSGGGSNMAGPESEMVA